MPIQPAIPFGGLAGLRFLDRTQARQFELFSKSPDVEREVAYFRETAAQATTVDALVGDRRLLGVVLGAFGLDEDIDKRAFVRKVIEEGTLEGDAFANRLVEPAYREMSAFLGFGDLGGLLVFESTREGLIERYRERQFEGAVGNVDLGLRLALNFRREANGIAADGGTDDAFWLKLLGSGPRRQVLETAFGLPDAFGLIDVDRQVAILKERSEALLGSSKRADLADPAVIEQIVERFLLNTEAATGQVPAGAPGATALQLLQTGTLGTLAGQNLFASGFL